MLIDTPFIPFRAGLFIILYVVALSHICFVRVTSDDWFPNAAQGPWICEFGSVRIIAFFYGGNHCMSTGRARYRERDDSSGGRHGSRGGRDGGRGGRDGGSRGGRGGGMSIAFLFYQNLRRHALT